MENEIIFATENETNQNIVNEVYKLRHETFIDRLDWDIQSTNGMERDHFDDLAPVHIAVKNEHGVSGCWRALPSKGDYMLKSIFPELLQGEQAPEEDDIWEISRFAVRKGSSKAERGYMGAVTLDLVKSFYDFAQENGIKSYVTVTTVACERLLRQLGVNLRRMGEGKSMQIGIERSVALKIEVDENLCLNSH